MHITQQAFGLVLIEVQLKDNNGVEVLTKLHQQSPDTAISVLTGYGSLETAVAALRQGAHDYLLKPCQTNQMQETILALLYFKNANWLFVCIMT